MSKEHNEAAGVLAQEIGEALLRFAAAMRGSQTSTQAVQVPATALPAGPRQREAMAVKGIDKRAGVTASHVAAELGIRQPNAYTLLGSLVDGGWLEQVPDVEPTHWRAVRATKS